MSGPILVTGATGFVGARLMPELQRAFPSRRLVPVSRSKPAPPGGVSADLSDRAACEAMVASVAPDIVVHLAAHASVAMSRLTPAAVWRDNRDASFHLARALRRHAPAAAVLFVSTAEVYGRSLNFGPADEETLPDPVGPYAHSKLAAERVFAAHLAPEASLLVVRPFNHTGPGQGEAFVVASFAAQIARIEAKAAAPTIHVGNLNARRDFLDVRDVARAYAQLLRTAQRPGRCRITINIARGEAVAVGEILKRLLALTDAKIDVRVDPARIRPNEIATATARCERLSRLIDWPPQRSLDETLETVLEDQRRRVR